MTKKILFISTLVLSSFLSPSIFAQEAEVDLFTLCSKFPHNSKCKDFEAPIPLKERAGEAANCQVFLGDFQKNAACKIKLTEDTLTFYQEQGDKIEQLDDQRLTVEYSIPLERIFISNNQIWNGVYRWEISYLEDAKTETKNSSNTLIVLTNEEMSKAIAEKFYNHTIADSIDMLAQAQEATITENNLDTKAQVQQLIETKECIGCNLENADLSGVDLEQANLEGTNFAGANLEGANLKNSYLMGANLEGANLNLAELGGAIFVLTQLNNATLKAANLQATNLHGADLRQADLEKASLRAPAFLQEANLQQANLVAADLRGANFYRADLTEANLQSANLRDTNVKLKNIPSGYTAGEIALDYLIGVPIFGLSNSGVDFKTNLIEANLTGANLREARLEQVSITDTNFSNANFVGAKIESTNLEEANFCGATFSDETPLSEKC
ncbi:Pentapeptide repeat protein [Hyella patelloides LEGE 07179]|uniref:Pentapeptide repeat protein n=1 Tax=Hyella patelloides LEGE 07179 TaxID=945734 RepID=A0A563W5F5_9CYAN|nr:pentapeptide repeat-containing protein [Hyella patelloides]VEP18870.1 Pentapeptide repeat protein [Hyella patelloides LEGE 07179]